MNDRRAKPAEHTPGPWKLDITGIGIRDLQENPLPIALCPPGLRPNAELHANAILICAAPEMLCALECIAEHSLKNKASKWNDELQDFVSTALKIAKGKL